MKLVARIIFEALFVAFTWVAALNAFAVDKPQIILLSAHDIDYDDAGCDGPPTR